MNSTRFITKFRANALNNIVSSRAGAVRCFTVSTPRFSQGSSDSDLVQKLQQELTFEKDSFDQGSAVPEWLSEFKKNSPWKIQDKPGEKEVALVREFGNEKIRAIFSTDALNDNMEDDLEIDQDGMNDPEAQEEEGEEGADGEFPVNMTVVVEKGKDDGALELTCQLADGGFYIENVSYSTSSALMMDETAEGDWARRGQYGGPVFADLDDGLQDTFNKFLQERGFNEELAEVVPSYIEYKEQKEYMNWLQKTAEFVQK